ncbi:MAG: hypothetical protein HQL18_04770, partial [Candidatus Omnitrophica bacterium]|nr:hypothetical protein [Candidatus Omnitrophota bacterium]
DLTEVQKQFTDMLVLGGRITALTEQIDVLNGQRLKAPDGSSQRQKVVEDILAKKVDLDSIRPQYQALVGGLKNNQALLPDIMAMQGAELDKLNTRYEDMALALKKDEKPSQEMIDLHTQILALRQALEDVKNVGGINLGDENLTINIKVDGNGMPLPLNMQDPAMINLEGLTPIIREMTPVTPANVPVLSELMQTNNSSV